MRKRGKFIVFEGADGAGTTTQAQLLCDNINASMSKECAMVGHTPSEGSIGTFTRNLIKNFQVKDWRVMQSLMYADMVDYTQNTIIPTLNSGINFICDRYYPSTLVYQSSLSEPFEYEESCERMRAMYDEMLGGCMYHEDLEFGYPLLLPDVAILLDLSTKALKQRVLDRGEPIDAYESDKQRMRLVALSKAWALEDFEVCDRVSLTR